MGSVRVLAMSKRNCARYFSSCGREVADGTFGIHCKQRLARQTGQDTRARRRFHVMNPACKRIEMRELAFDLGFIVLGHEGQWFPPPAASGSRITASRLNDAGFCRGGNLTRFSIRRPRPASCGEAASALQAPFMELLRSGAELTQLVDGCACRRERECLERFGEHLVEAITRRYARGDVRTEMLAG
jgi:hypothetical protein